MMKSQLKYAMCQMLVKEEKQINLQHANDMINKAASNGCEMVILPECFNSTYATVEFPKNAEVIPSDMNDVDKNESPSIYMLKEAAKRNNIYLVGGSIPEKEVIGGKTFVYNTSTVYNNKGELIAKHRKASKVHLFDINVPGGQKFFESDTLTAGSHPTTFNSPWGKIGLGICYDIRFPELSMLMTKEGCRMLIFPSAFNTTTGPLHWQLLARSRAVDNQLFVTMVSPARNMKSNYHAYGHSICVDPWGKIVCEGDEKENIYINTIDFAQIDAMRAAIPVLKQKRNDIYELTRK